jgi:hypothetical protein
MKPALGDLLLTSAQTLGTDVAPLLADKPYAMGHVGTIGLLLVFLAQEAERAADTLYTDNRELRALFADAAGAPLGADLSSALRHAAAAAETSLHVRVLEAENAALKSLLIALHHVVDESPMPWARDLQRAIWAHLKASADRRALVLPGA